MKAIMIQLSHELKRFKTTKNSIETIFIGGGTPSTIEAKRYEEFFKTLKPYLKDNTEITIEANPNSANLEWLKDMKNLGVNRVSFGVQSFNEKKLNYLGRNHNKTQAINAVKNANKVGFKNISIDIIYDTYHDTKKLLEDDLNLAFSLPINHLSSYSLTIEKGTTFAKNRTKPKDDLNLTKWFIQKVKTHFPQYEISNFGTYNSKHNLGYWQLKNYIGIGAGAVGFHHDKRYYPTPNIQNYIKNPLNIRVENLKQEDIKLEKIFLGLRSIVGVEKELLDKQKLILLLDEGKVYQKDNKIFNKNYLLADELALFLT